MLDLICVYRNESCTRFYIYINDELLSSTPPDRETRLQLVLKQRIKRDRLVSVLIDTAK